MERTTKTGSDSRSAFALSTADAERLRTHVEAAVKEARRGRESGVLAAVTVPLPAATDPSAVVVASRQGEEPWFCFEQPVVVLTYSKHPVQSDSKRLLAAGDH